MKYDKIFPDKIKAKIVNIFQTKLMRSISRKLLKLRQLCCHSFLYMYTPQFIDPDNFETRYYQFLSDKKIKPRNAKENYGGSFNEKPVNIKSTNLTPGAQNL